MSGLDAVRAQYEAAYERHAEAEQLAVATGDMDTAEGHHRAALNIAWSLTAELDDPATADPCLCPKCWAVALRRIV